ncbi:hypothetical protein FACS189490_01850 [Clostridia bacterium]|nr:hypothetical protein FACS189490_01850 [Clostridia bacterium]
MKENKEEIVEKLRLIAEKARLVIISALFLAMVGAICVKLFDLQIINGKPYVKPEVPNVTRTVNLTAPRGEIFDRYGRPLAVNETIYTLKLDPSGNDTSLKLSAIAFNIVSLLTKNNETLINDFKITEDMQYDFGGSKARKTRWLLDMGVIEPAKDGEPDPTEPTALDAYTHLLEFFGVPDELSDREKYETVSLCAAVFMQRYALDHITLANKVKQETIVYIEEHNQDFPGVYADLSYLRHYPEGEIVSHTVGYIRPISSDEYEANKILGYSNTDLIGKDGIEKFFELNLRGEPGSQLVEIAPNGRRVGVLEQTPPTPGDNVYLTIDAVLQKKVYDTLKDELTLILINKVIGASAKEEPITPKQAVISMLNAGTISVSAILSSGEDFPYSFGLKKRIRENVELTALFADAAYLTAAKEYLTEETEAGKITVTELFAVMGEQGLISFPGQIKDEKSFLVEKLQLGEITPQMLNIAPCTGSAIVEDVNTGEILAAATYPTYDNNYFVNDFDEDYYNKLLSDPTLPMLNRPFVEKLAPGSTFKMVTAVAGLESGVITPTEKIYDENLFTKARLPYARCWSGASHGLLTVSDALEVSCNYFFFETSFRLGNFTTGDTIQGIDKLNDYMIKFGLNDPCGVEIYEPYGYADTLNVSSPDLKTRKEKLSWVDGDTIRTAIGQAFNAYSAANMVKYVSMLAAGGVRYQSHFLSRITDSNNNLLSEHDNTPELVLKIKDEYLNAVYNGMLQVTGVKAGTGRGTARSVFKDFPINVAGKTGTAEQSGGVAHASFAGFAPFEEPQIAVYVQIPRGDTPNTPYPAAYVAKEIISYYFGLTQQPEKASEQNILQP